MTDTASTTDQPTTTSHPSGAVCPSWCQMPHEPDSSVLDHSCSVATIAATGRQSALVSHDDGIMTPAVFVALTADMDDAPAAEITIQIPTPHFEKGNRWADVLLRPDELEQLRKALNEAQRLLADGGSPTYSPEARTRHDNADVAR